MDEKLNDMKEKLFRSIDPNDSYSNDDFINEFGKVSYDEDFLTPYVLNLNFVNKSNNQDPEYATKHSAGFDLRANIEKTIHLEPGSVEIVPTGLYFEIPQNFEMQIRPRSGLAAKNHVTVLNSPGTIDSDYRGEIMVILINHGKSLFTINNGDRIAQAVVAQTASNYVRLKRVSEISEDTERGAGKFGSTGIK